MRFAESSREFFESQIAAERFSLKAIFDHLSKIDASPEGAPEPLEVYASIRKYLGPKVGDYVLQGLLRSVFFIELVKLPKVETTKFAVRWSPLLSQANDPRHCSYEDCLGLFETLCEELNQACESEGNVQLLRAFAGRHLLPYEAPLDYRERHAGNSAARIHTRENLRWVWDDLARRIVGLRAFLFDAGAGSAAAPHARVLAAAYDKIKVKTYLTDRVLVGDHKTNREKRWEIHPSSVHFALRRTCWEIEHTLIQQMCHFDGFPPELFARLEEAKLIEPLASPFRCPITMEPLSFEEFRRELTQPRHGRSSFQVGHLNPLKLVAAEPDAMAHTGHSAQNISWISADGNRIQGALSLQETRALVRRIADNYESAGLK